MINVNILRIIAIAIGVLAITACCITGKYWLAVINMICVAINAVGLLSEEE